MSTAPRTRSTTSKRTTATTVRAPVVTTARTSSAGTIAPKAKPTKPTRAGTPKPARAQTAPPPSAKTASVATGMTSVEDRPSRILVGPRVSVTRQGGKAEGVTVAVIRTRALLMLARMSLYTAELSVLLTNDRTIHELNAQYRGKDRPTDVLAFAMNEGEGVNAPGLLGDVVISLDTATRQANGRKRPVLDEVTMLLAHGLLHLLGYDHAEPDEAHEMRNATRVLVRAANQG